MKNKMNKKGFTLVELLAVVVILLAISVVAITSISAAIERQNAKKDETTKKVIISYAKLYFDEHKNNTSLECVDVSSLITLYNLDTETLKNSDGNVFDGSVKKSNNKYEYFDDNCQKIKQ